MAKQTEEKEQETCINAEAHRFTHTEIPYKHKTRNHNRYIRYTKDRKEKK